MSAELRGTVKWFDPAKRYGFVTGDDGNDYLLPKRKLLGGREPMNGERALFEPATRPRGRFVSRLISLDPSRAPGHPKGAT